MTFKPTGSFYCINNHKAAYLAIKKCACTSIANYIAGHKTKNILRPIWVPENAQVNFDLVTTDEQALEDYFTFTFVRNPYDRFLSFYRNWIANPPHEQILNHYEKFGLCKDMPFDACVKAFVKIPDVSLLEVHTVPMSRYVLRGKTLRVKFIGKLENMAVDFGHVKAACSLNGEIGHINRKQSAVKRTNPYTPELRALIYDFYRFDFDLFGYDM